MMAVELQLTGFPFTVHNVCSGLRNQLEAGQLLSLTTHRNTMVVGNFNAHHSLLQSVSCAIAASRHLVTLLEELPSITLLNTGEHTHVRDLMIVSERPSTWHHLLGSTPH